MFWYCEHEGSGYKLCLLLWIRQRSRRVSGQMFSLSELMKQTNKDRDGNGHELSQREQNNNYKRIDKFLVLIDSHL